MMHSKTGKGLLSEIDGLHIFLKDDFEGLLKSLTEEELESIYKATIEVKGFDLSLLGKFENLSNLKIYEEALNPKEIVNFQLDYLEVHKSPSLIEIIDQVNVNSIYLFGIDQEVCSKVLNNKTMRVLGLEKCKSEQIEIFSDRLEEFSINNSKKVKKISLDVNSLKTVQVSYCSNLADISANNASFENLSIESCERLKLSSIGKFLKLRNLTVMSKYDIESLCFLRPLSQLEELTMRSCTFKIEELEELFQLEELINLKKVWISSTNKLLIDLKEAFIHSRITNGSKAYIEGEEVPLEAYYDDE